MARGFVIPGEAMVSVRGPAGFFPSDNANKLGLATDEIQVRPSLNKLDVKVNAWGEDPVDVQQMGGEATITMNLVHVDRTILDTCIKLAMGAAVANTPGTFGRAGLLMGNGLAMFNAGNRLISLNITSPIGGGGRAVDGDRPWHFLSCYLADNPVVFPVGVQRSIIAVTWRAICYTNDPWGDSAGVQTGTSAGTGKAGAVLWNHTLDAGATP